MAAYDLTNKVFVKLKVNYLEKKDSSGHNWWNCTCECGNSISVRAGHLINGSVTMCKDCKKKLHSIDKSIDGNNSVVNHDLKIKSRENSTYDNIIDCTNDGVNLLSVPIIFKIVHAINADLTYAENKWDGTDTLAKNIDKFFKIREALDNLSSITWEVGEVINTSVVYHLLTKKNRYDVVAYGDVYNCLEELKNLAISNGDYYLAFPKIGCGQDNLEWDYVKPMIEDVFGNTEFQIMLV